MTIYLVRDAGPASCDAPYSNKSRKLTVVRRPNRHGVVCVVDMRRTISTFLLQPVQNSSMHVHPCATFAAGHESGTRDRLRATRHTVHWRRRRRADDLPAETTNLSLCTDTTLIHVAMRYTYTALIRVYSDRTRLRERSLTTPRARQAGVSRCWLGCSCLAPAALQCWWGGVGGVLVYHW